MLYENEHPFGRFAIAVLLLLTFIACESPHTVLCPEFGSVRVSIAEYVYVIKTSVIAAIN